MACFEVTCRLFAISRRQELHSDLRTLQDKLMLPPELTDHIIGFVDKWDKKTLCNCTLVSRRWLPASRHALFRYISVQNATTLKLLIQRILHSESAHHYLAGVHMFALTGSGCSKLFASAANGGHVYHEERVAGVATSLQLAEIMGPESRLFLYHFSGHLPSIKTLSFSALDWISYTAPMSSEPLLLSRFPSIKHLDFFGCNLPSFHFFRRAVTSLPHLEKLSCLNVIWPRPCTPAGSSSTRTHIANSGPELMYLEVAQSTLAQPPYVPATSLLCWLSHTRSRETLRELTMQLPQVVDSTGLLDSTVREFMEIVPNLRTLCVPIASMCLASSGC